MKSDEEGKVIDAASSGQIIKLKFQKSCKHYKIRKDIDIF